MKKSRQLLYYERNREKILTKRRAYYQSHKKNQAEQDRQYYLKNTESIKEKARKYRKENRNKIAAHCRGRYRIDAQYRMRRLLRSRLKRAIGRNCKRGSAIQDLGCSIADLKIYLENKFLPGMSWDKMGQIHIDHKIPLAKGGKHIIGNIQILCPTCNIKKGAKI